MGKNRLYYENQLKDDLINKILVVSTITAIIALISAQLRAMNIGWTYRDIIQFSVVGCITGLTVIPIKLGSHFKALFLIIIFSIGGISGVYTLGMLAGTIFVFPAAAVIVAVFYSFRATLTYIALSLLFCCFTAIKFCYGKTKPVSNAEFLMSNYFHWMVYIICIGLFFAVACVAIHNYRRIMGILIDEISRQRDDLTKANEELRSAANNVKILSGLLPICAVCKNIRDDKGYWNQIELYIKEHSEADFSHGICPDCFKKLYPREYEELQKKK